MHRLQLRSNSRGLLRLFASTVVCAAIALAITTSAVAGSYSFGVAIPGTACYGYGSTGAYPTYAAANTQATSSSGIPLSSCFRSIPRIEWCAEQDCWLDTSNPGGYTLQYESQLGAYSSNALHGLSFYNGGGWTGAAACTSSWTSGSTTCP